MATYLGWTIVFIPDSPPAPQTIEPVQIESVAMNVSPFTGQQQVQDWNATRMEMRVTMPPMPFAQAQPWIDFMRQLKGAACVFQFTAAFMAAFPADLGSRYWRLKGNSRKWSVVNGKIYGFSFDIMEAL